MPPKIDIATAPTRVGIRYPSPFDVACQARVSIRLGDAAGLTQFGVNLSRLPPGQWSGQRHWHGGEDEFVWVVEGEVVLVSDAGEEVLRAGDCVGYRAGDPDAHHLQNRSDRDAVLLEVGARAPQDDVVHYPDIDLALRRSEGGFSHKDGSPYVRADPMKT